MPVVKTGLEHYIFKKTGSKVLSKTLTQFIIDSESEIYLLNKIYKRSVPTSASKYIRKINNYNVSLTGHGRKILSIMLSGWMREYKIKKKIKILNL